MKPLIYMAIGAMLPIAAYELMQSKAYRDMLNKLRQILDSKCDCNSSSQ